MLKRVGKFGPFIACSGYPDCTNTREVETQEPESESGEEEIEPCENCGKPMAVKRGRFGQFLACTGYPECKTTRKLIATKQGGLTRRQAGPDPRRDVPALQREPGHQAGPLRRVHRLHAGIPSASYVKHKTTGRDVPEGRRQGRRGRRAQVEARQDRSSAARTTRTATSCSGTGRSSRPCPKCDAPYLVEKIDQEARPAASLQQRGLRLRAIRGTSRNSRVE